MSAPLGPCRRFADYRVFHSIGPSSETCFRARIQNSKGEPCCKDKVMGLFSVPTMVHICLNGDILQGHEWCMVDWLEKAHRCHHCLLRFDTDKSDARLEAEAAEIEAYKKEKAAREQQLDEDDDTPWGLPSAKERRAKMAKPKQAKQTTCGDSRVALPATILRETLDLAREEMRKVTTADLDKGYCDPLRFFREDSRRQDGWY